MGKYISLTPFGESVVASAKSFFNNVKSSISNSAAANDLRGDLQYLKDGTWIGSNYPKKSSAAASGSSGSGLTVGSSGAEPSSNLPFVTGVDGKLSFADQNYQSVADYINQIAQANNDWSAAQAQKQMDFQKMMSDTAHQREVADLKAAGLNPVLSAGGSGASTPVGAMAATDDSNTRLIADLAYSALEAVQNTAVGVSAFGSGSFSHSTSSKGLFSGFSDRYAHDKAFKKVFDTGANLAGGIAKAAILKAIL